MFRFLQWRVTRLNLAILLVVGSAVAADRRPKPDDISQFIGTQECRGCHDEVFRSFETTPHWKTALVRNDVARRPSAASAETPAGRGTQFTPEGCESCHGPGRAHADAAGDPEKIVSFKRLTRAQVAERCLSCHQYTEEHGNFRRSVHRNAQVTCLDCHSMHHAAAATEPRTRLLRKPQLELCTSCHAPAAAEFARPFHHRVPEKLITCTECHNQHGGFLTRQLRSTAAQDAICGKCHAETVGPFAFEHAPVKTEGCSACHTPHGSVNGRLLKRAQVNLLCLECHTLSPAASGKGVQAFHNQDKQFQACTLCHVAIHGSNVSEKLLR